MPDTEKDAREAGAETITIADVDSQNVTAVASLVKVLQHFGVEIDAEAFVKEHAKDEISWESLTKLARQHHIRARVSKPTMEELREVELPAMTRMMDGTYVVVAVAGDDVVYLLDPRQAQPVVLSSAQFAEVWGKELLLFSGAFSWDYFKKRYNAEWFAQVFLHYKRYFYEVLAASFFLMLMGVMMPLITQVVIDKVIGNAGYSTLTVIGCGMIIFFLMQSLLMGLKTYVMNHTTNKLDAILGARLFHHLISLPLPYFENRRVGDTLMRVGALSQIRQFLTEQGLMTILDVFFSVIFVALMFWYNVPLALISLLCVPLYLMQNFWAIPIIKKKIEDIWRAGAANNAFMVEAVTNIETIKAMAIEPQFNYRWENLVARYVRTTFENVKFRLATGAFSQMVQTLVTMGIMWYGGHLVMDGQMTLGQLIAFQMISRQATEPMTKLLTMWPEVQQTGLSLERVSDILNSRPEPVQGAGKRGEGRLQGHIVFEDVSFRYRPDLPLVLEGINLDVQPGEKIGIVGRSGSGKSTLTSVVQHFYVPEAGTVSIDGIDTREADLSWMRGQIGVVMQENYLFDSSIRDNIAVTRPDATMDEVIAAARLAGAHDFILELKDGYDTKAGERGAALSGGQRQRVAIARALLSDPPILIFDEATSALDYESERIIMENMDAIAARRTMLIIAHRLSTVRRCDRLIVVEKGHIVECGTHDELMALGGMYKHLYEQQEGGKR